MNPSVFCFLLTLCFLPSLLGGYNEPQWVLFSAHSLLFAFIIGRIQWTPVCFVFCSLFAFCLHYWEDTMNPCVLFSAHSLLFVFIIGRIHTIQWTQDVFCLFSADALLYAFVIGPIGRLHVIQWTQYVFCLFSADALLFAFIIGPIGRLHVIQWTQYVFCLFFAFCLRYWEVTMNPSVFCFLLTFCFLPSLLGGIVCMQQTNTCCCTVIHTDCVLTIVSCNFFWP